MKRLITGLIAAACLAAGAPSLSAQGAQTGVLTGSVRTSDALVAPGVTVTVSSPVLQGTRSAVTDVSGTYLFRGLPPGPYRIEFRLEGLAPLDQEVDLALGSTRTADATMVPAGVLETVTVVATAPPVLTRAGTQAQYSADAIDALPAGRTPFLIAELAPGLTDNTPNAGQLTISGAFAYDNVFLVNGVDVNDNVLGTANNLFIEEAIDRAQVLSSGVSAEYGRFSGGVINVVTRSGGNLFSGSYRANLSSPSWTSETPLERSNGVDRSGDLQVVHEATLGGPVARDRLWFFGAMRREASVVESVLAQTGTPVARETANLRYETKLTGRLGESQTVSGTFIDNDTKLAQPSLPFSIDPATISRPETPNSLFVANWKGLVGSRVHADAQYSQKRFSVHHGGANATSLADSPIITLGATGVPRMLHYNAPFFDETDPESRDNRQFTGRLSYFLSSPGLGTHDLTAGFEHYTSTRVGGNSQSPTGFVFWADYLLGPDGRPVLDAEGRLVPRFVPGMNQYWHSLATRGAQLDITTLSFFLNDRWRAGRHWTFDLGVRSETGSTSATGQPRSSGGTVVVPRLGATYDVTGNSRTVLQATYGQYSGKYHDVQFGRNTPVGTSALLLGVYTGPAGEGRDFAPGFDPSNYMVVAGNFPTANVFLDESLTPPLTHEFTLSGGRDLGRGHVKASYIRRSTTNFVEDFVTIEGGRTTAEHDGRTFGTFDNVFWRNSDEPSREYQALLFEGRHRLNGRWHVAGHWTVQVRHHGDFEGETPGQPAQGSLRGNYPEVLVLDRNSPGGRLDDFQRHKIRVWTSYDLDLGPYGTVGVAPLWRYNSARTYSLTANAVPLSAVQLARSPGYAQLPNGGAQPLFFGARGSESFAGYHLVDLALHYSIPARGTVRPWLKVEVLNLLDNDKLIAWDTTVAADPSSPLDADGLPTGYVEGPRFGEATSNASFPRPRPGLDGGRTFLMAFGLRF